jgi:uncharacterized protein (DUF433 family)
MAKFQLYGGRDPRTLPAYSVREAARYLHIPAATLRSWVAGREYPVRSGVGSFRALIRCADQPSVRLSFENLVEAHVLRALREYGVPLRAVRPAIAYAEQELRIERLLLSKDALLTDGENVFLERVGELINLTRSGQLAIRSVLREYLHRVERDTSHLPIKLYPFVGAQNERRTILIDPSISFGRPVVARSGIRTQVLADRINAGESIADLTDDYGLTTQEVEDAIVYHQAAA